jgi:OOP family OmpA-OmpF porin
VPLSGVFSRVTEDIAAFNTSISSIAKTATASALRRRPRPEITGGPSHIFWAEQRKRAALDPQAEQVVVDQAARLYPEGNPHVMLVVGHTDTKGDELYNLYLSARRAGAVKGTLAARGIPAKNA